GGAPSRLADDVREPPPRTDISPSARARPQPAPVPVCPAVRADGHPAPVQLTDAVAIEPAGLAQQAGQNEELGFQATLAQPGKRDLDVGRVPVVEGEAHVVPVGHRVQNLFELRDAHPRGILAWIQWTSG